MAWVDSTWAMLLDSALLFIAGLALAGLVRLFLHERNINRLLTNSPRTAVWRAALLGVPLPLCSCSVLPVAHQLRKSGAGRGATVSFLVSTPESGVDSIALTYSLMDPIMTVARPVVAFTTALVAGLWEARHEVAENTTTRAELPTAVACSDGCSCHNESPNSNGPLGHRLWQGLKYSYTDLVADLAPYLLVGYLLAGLVGALWGADAGQMPEFFRTGLGAYAGALLIGLPLYICATSSTPLAAALVAAGFSPGAALVFLIVGPATNLASLTVVRTILTGRALVRYLLSVVVVALAGGVALDWLYSRAGIDPVFHATSTHHESFGFISILAAVLLSALVLFYSARHYIKKFSH